MTARFRCELIVPGGPAKGRALQPICVNATKTKTTAKNIRGVRLAKLIFRVLGFCIESAGGDSFEQKNAGR
jgi:hypothetical protein